MLSWHWSLTKNKETKTFKEWKQIGWTIKYYKSRGEGGGVRNILWGEKSWRRLEKKTWGCSQNVVECFPSLSSGYNEQFPKRANWIQTRSDRKTSPSQPPPLLSPITPTPRWSCFILSPAWSSLLLSPCSEFWTCQNVCENELKGIPNPSTGSEGR